MQPNEALQYLTQLANDHVRTLPTSSQVLVTQYAQQCIETIAKAIEPQAIAEPEKETGRKLRPVEDAASPSSQ